MQLQLDLSDRIYQLQRQALLENNSLSDAARELELEKLELAREREQLQLRMNAALQEEIKSLEKQRGVLDSIVGLAGNLLSGRGLSGGSIGGVIGGMIGRMVPVVGGLLGGIGSMIGSRIGKLFGGADKRSGGSEGAAIGRNPQLKALDAIQRAQQETIATIEQQTEQLLNPQNSYLNLPTSFTLPKYKPAIAPFMGGGSTPQAISYGDVAVNMEFNLAGGHSAEEIKELALLGVQEGLADMRRRSPKKSTKQMYFNQW